ncbi:MAG: hypothetical protein CMO01_18185 [Thalassobius sp.]|nr:hypothetical protein [Thalassovita sp.]
MRLFTILFLFLITQNILSLNAQTARPAYNTGSGFFVSDGNIYDPNGMAFTPMGYNTSVFWNDNEACKLNNMSEHIPNSGANAVRIISQTEGAYGWNANPKSQRDLVERAVNAGIVPMLEMHNSTCDKPEFETITDYWTSEQVIKICNDFEKYLWVNIANEHNFESFETWRDSYITTIKQFREKGIKNLIVIDAGKFCGQNPEMFTEFGKDVLEADPEKNVVFSIHLYGYWQTADKSFTDWTPPFSVEKDLPALKSTGLPIIVGEFGWDEPEGFSGNYTPEMIIEVCKQNGIGWYFWAFFDGEGVQYYSVLKNACNGIETSNLTEAGKFIIPYIQKNAQKASVFN